ncbi:MAG TPA: ABC transporter ATP-binding protein [Phycisphaerales bacterium]|nr:ABC transporter ATP-binding protein [Phycisphaerales bacterium]
MASGSIIDISDAYKTFGRNIHALRGVDMQVAPGEVFGLLGPNGAGKSTLVKILMTVVRPTRLAGTLLGRPVGDPQTLARVGYLPEHHNFPPYLTGRQVIQFVGAMTGMPRQARRRSTDRLLKRVGMWDWADKRVKSYSKGMLQRIGLAQALVNTPELVLLDEPTDGVDPVGRQQIRDLLLELRDEGMTVFLNSHLLSELEMVCNRVAIMVKGRVAMQGTIEELTADSRRFEIRTTGPAPDWIRSLPDVTSHPEDRLTLLRIRGQDAEAIQPLIDRLRSEKRAILEIKPVRESLEDLFMRAVSNDEGGFDEPGAFRGNEGEQA